MPLTNQNPKYKGLSEEEIKFIGSASWAGALNLIFFLFNKAPLYAMLVLFLFLPVLIPVIGVFILISIFIICIMYGRKIVWSNGDWNSFNEYKKRMLKWDAVAKTIIICLGLALLFVIAIAGGRGVGNQFSAGFHRGLQGK